MKYFVAYVYLVFTISLMSCGWIIGESNDANLKSVAVSAGALEPEFSSEKTDYALTVSTDSFTITSATKHKEADLLIKFNDGSYILIGSGEAITLKPSIGESIILIKVVAADGGATKDYKIVVTR